MNVKTYLMTNSSPLLDNPKNILILEWLEGNSFCTLTEISTRTNIPLKEVSEIIQILYKNNLVTYIEDKYEITNDGIKLLDKLGLSDLQISTLLEQTDFQPEEYAIYKSIFHEWRSNFLSTYLFISDTIENEYNNICMSFSNIWASPKIGHSIFTASLLHKFAQILYTEETSKLMMHYNALFEYSLFTHCLSSEVYHTTSKYWKSDKKRVLLINSLDDEINTFLKKSLHVLYPSNIITENNIFIVPGNHDIRNNINYDFSTSYNLIKDPELLNKIFTSQNLTELTEEYNWTEYQAKFILKSIRSKIDVLLQPEKSISQL